MSSVSPIARSALRVTAGGLVALALLKGAALPPFRRATPLELAAAYEARAGQAAPGGGGEVRFSEIAATAGLAFVHDNGSRGRFEIPEQIGSGVGVLDYDGDADLDVFVAGGGVLAGGPGQSSRLFRNDGGAFVDVTEAAGAAVAGHAYGVACADYDGDGRVDLLVTRLGPSVLLHNEGGGRFRDVSAAAGLGNGVFGTSAAFFDYDRDGRLDLYVAEYVAWKPQMEMPCFAAGGRRDFCSPTVYHAPSVHHLYHNAGGGRLEDVSLRSGIASEKGNGLGVLAFDFDGDGWLDLYVANDQTPAFLWRNRGDGTFENVAALVGAATNARGSAIAGMGIACEDFDGDGSLDLFVTNIRGQMQLALKNQGGVFEDLSWPMGLDWSQRLTGFGISVLDADRDGEMEAFIAAGGVQIPPELAAAPNPYLEESAFLRIRKGRFEEVRPPPLRIFDVARASLVADLDDDGRPDLLVTSNGGPLRYLHNDSRDDNAWLTLDLVTRSRAAIGARAVVTAGGRKWIHEARPQQSYLASGDPRLFFGLGKAGTVDQLEVTWPDATKEVFTGLPVRRTVRIEQGKAPQVLPSRSPAGGAR